MKREKRGFLRERGGPCRFVGCLHLAPLPGSAGWGGDLRPIVKRCLEELAIYESIGVDGVILENTHDVPYLRGPAEPGTVAAMAAVAWEVRCRSQWPVGVQILAAADIEALELAVACDLDFIRAEGFAFAHVADEGLIEGNAGRLLRRRAHLTANHIEIWTDVKKKHSAHAITGDLSIAEEAKGAGFFRADGVIVTGAATGAAARLEDVREARSAGLRIAVGSGITLDNIDAFAEHADVLIVGSACKVDGRWENAVDADRTRALVDALRLCS